MSTPLEKDNMPSELELLKTQADILQLKYKSNVTAKTLRKQIMEALAEDDDSEGLSNKERQEMINENTKLVRCIIMPVASHMRDYQGQIFSAGNSALGIISKYVLFNTEYHVPNILLKQIQAQEFQYFVKRNVNGEEFRESKMRKAFNVEILDPLTDDELKELARNQENRNAIEA